MSQSNVQQGVLPVYSDDDFTGKEGYVVERTATGVSLADADTDAIYGVITDGKAATELSDILPAVVGEQFRAEVSGSISEGGYAAPAAGGKVKAAAAGDSIIAIAEEGMADGQMGLFRWVVKSTFVAGAALTTAETDITHTAPSSADYALQALTDSGGFGFATADEGHTTLQVVQNTKTRLDELEARLQAAGIIA